MCLESNNFIFDILAVLGYLLVLGCLALVAAYPPPYPAEWLSPGAFLDGEERATQCPAIDPEFAVHLPHPQCTKFYKCSNGVPYELECPDELHFNQDKSVCDWPIDAGCVEGAAPPQ